MKKVKLTLLLLLVGVLCAQAQWTSASFNLPNDSRPISTYGFNNDRMQIHPISGDPYMIVTRSGTGHKIDLMRYNGNAWVYDATNITPGATSSAVLKIAENGDMFIGFVDHSRSQKITVMHRPNGSSTWSDYGTPGFTPDNMFYFDMELGNHEWNGLTIAVAFAPRFGNVNTMHYNQTNQSWQQLGNSNLGYSAGTKHKLYITYEDNYISVGRKIGNTFRVDQIDVEYPYTSWSQLSGLSINTSLDYWGMTSIQGTNMVALLYQETGNGVNNILATVYNGSTWGQIGSTPVLSKTIVNNTIYEYALNIAFHPVTYEPYVVLHDAGQSNFGISVRKFSNNSWGYVGTAAFSNKGRGDIKFHPFTKAPYVHSFANGTPNQAVHYLDDGCSRVLSSTSEQITSPHGGGNNYEFEVYNEVSGAASLVSSANNYILITDVPNWAPNTPYRIRSRALYGAPFFSWSAWSETCYIQSPSGEFEGRGKKAASASANLDNDLSLFPNPSTGLVSLNLSSGWDKSQLQLGLYNASGQWVMDIDASQFNAGGEAQLDLSTLPKGMYIMKGSVSGIPVTKKLILE